MLHRSTLALLLALGADGPRVSDALVPSRPTRSVLVMEVFERTISLPVVPTAEQTAGVRETTLLVSTDGGRSWRHTGVSNPNPPGRPLAYCFPADGLYEFRLRLVYRDGKVEFVPGNLRYLVRVAPVVPPGPAEYRSPGP